MSWHERVNRRTLIGAAVGAGIVLVAGDQGYRRFQSHFQDLDSLRAEQQRLGLNDFPPHALFMGEVEVWKGVNARIAPMVTRHDNTIYWQNIAAINGVTIDGVDSFKIQNPHIVNAHIWGGVGDRFLFDQDPWLQLRASVRKGVFGINGMEDLTIYINMSERTADYVKWQRKGLRQDQFVPTRKEEDTYLLFGSGKRIRQDEVGIVSVR